jgi:hypothetical protein
MRIAIIILLFGMLGASAFNLYLIARLERVYTKVWGTDVSSLAWERKRWAFLLMMLAQLTGVLSLFSSPKGWTALVYVFLMFLFLLGYSDSYRILLRDLKKLPRKGTTLDGLSEQLDVLTGQVADAAIAANEVAKDLSIAHARADAVASSNHGAAADAATQQTPKEKAIDEEERERAGDVGIKHGGEQMKEEDNESHPASPRNPDAPTRPASGRPLDEGDEPEDPAPGGIIIAPGKGDDIPPEPPKQP